MSFSTMVGVIQKFLAWLFALPASSCLAKHTVWKIRLTVTFITPGGGNLLDRIGQNGCRKLIRGFG
jgi:hypothetical protein